MSTLIIRTDIAGHYNPSIGYDQPFSEHSCCLCYFINKLWALQFKVDCELQFHEKLFMGILFTFKQTNQKYFFEITFLLTLMWAWDLNLRLMLLLINTLLTWPRHNDNFALIEGMRNIAVKRRPIFSVKNPLNQCSKCNNSGRSLLGIRWRCMDLNLIKKEKQF